MKTLTEQEQIAKRQKELWDTMQFQEQEIEQAETALRRYKNKWFPEAWRIKYMEGNILRMREVCAALREYRDSLQERSKTQ